MISLAGKRVLITGGSRGLGRTLVQTFAEGGAKVAFTYTRDAATAEEARQLAGEHGRAYRVSVLDSKATAAMVSELETAWGGLDVLVNNAGLTHNLPLALLEEEDFDEVMDVNVKGAFLTSKAVLRGMIRRRGGVVLFMGSLAGVRMLEAPIHYCASKAALVGMSDALSKEVARYGVRVLCLAPGLLEDGLGKNLPEARLRDYLKHCSMGRVGTFREVAAWAAFLVSDESSYTSGTTVVLDGGVLSVPRRADRAVSTDGFGAYGRHVNPALSRFLALSGRDFRFVHAEGFRLTTDDGRVFDDWIAGFGALNLGHRPGVVQRALVAHAESSSPDLYVEAPNPFSGALAERLLAALGFGDGTAFFSNSGSEAVEAALKTAIAATGRNRIVYAAGGWHGTTLGALSCMGKGLYRSPFRDVLLPFTEAPWGDLRALESELGGGEVAGVLIEPMQMESGARLLPPAFWSGLRALCDRTGTLLLLDEVQTGMGRSGAFAAFHRLGISPDIVMLAKALGGGVLPIGATVMGRGIWDRAYGSYLRSEIHHSTFGGNALACRVALLAVEALSDESFLVGVRARASRLFTALEDAIGNSPSVRAIRHLGLLGGVELAEEIHPMLAWENLGLEELRGYPSSGPLLLERLQRRGIFAQICGHAWNVLRVEPPLIVDDEGCDRFVAAVAEGVEWLDAHR